MLLISDTNLSINNEVKLFTHCSLLLNFCLLLVTFCTLLVTFCSLLVTFCLFCCYFLPNGRYFSLVAQEEILKDVFLSKKKLKS